MRSLDGFLLIPSPVTTDTPTFGLADPELTMI